MTSQNTKSRENKQTLSTCSSMNGSRKRKVKSKQQTRQCLMVPCTSTTHTANVMDRVRREAGGYSWGRSGDRKGPPGAPGLPATLCFLLIREWGEFSFQKCPGFVICALFCMHVLLHTRTHTEARCTCVRFSYRLKNYANFL